MTEKAPVKQSPAPTVSIILNYLRIYSFEEAGHFTFKFFEIRLDPCFPSLSKTFKFGCLEIILFLISLTISSKLIVWSSLTS